MEHSGETDIDHTAYDGDASAVTAKLDLFIALAFVITVVVAAIRFDAHEALVLWTQRWEILQLDELLIGMFAMILCLGVLTWRRYRQAANELLARRTAERRLGVLLADNRRLATELIRAQELERKALARELHDEMGQYLNVMKLDLKLLTGTSGITRTELDCFTQRTGRNIDHIQRSVSDMLLSLRPVGLEELGLIAAIEECVERWRARMDQTEITLDLDRTCDNLDENTALATYRLIQEGLTNSIRHANAGKIRINLEYQAGSTGDEIRLCILDNGRGAQPGLRSNGMGLFGMRERVYAMNGSFSVSTSPGRGFELVALYPAHRHSI